MVFTRRSRCTGSQVGDQANNPVGKRQRSSREETGVNSQNCYSHSGNAGPLDAKNKDELAQRKGNTQAKYTKGGGGDVNEGQVKTIRVREDNQRLGVK